MPPMLPMRVLSGWSRAWRAVTTVAVFGSVIAGSVVGSDFEWPFGPMSQFAFTVSNTGGQVVSPFVEARTVEGRLVPVELSAGGIGLPRAEIEEQLWRFTADPSLLQTIAVAHARRHPHQPRYAEVYLRNRVTDLAGGKAVSTTVVTVASWRVTDPADPPELHR